MGNFDVKMWSGYVMNCKNSNLILNLARLKLLRPRKWPNSPRKNFSTQEAAKSCAFELLNLKICKPEFSHLLAEETSNFVPFLHNIKLRRAEARRSILVQVHSSQSFKDLHVYCSSIGSIKNMFHYTTGVEPMVTINNNQYRFL